jgi:MoxR-like ATPase
MVARRTLSRPRIAHAEEHQVAISQQTPAQGATFADHHTAVLDNIAQVIQGKPDVIELVLLCLVSEGHLLIEDVPGVGKTSLAKALAASIDGTFGRLQFTPDLLPTDVVGVTVWNRNTSEFEFRPGPVFGNIVLADEINRASPKTQSALLEAMAEAQVTVDGTTYPLASPFMVIATQNPIEHEGTYPLPESQLDRFLMRVSVGYPSADSELQILDTHGDHDALGDIGAVITVADVRALADAAKSVHVAPALKSYLVELANASRRHPHLALGMSPRATLALQRVARARAAASGRTYVVPDDLKALAEPVLAHRLLVTPEAQLQGISAADALTEVLRAVPIPAGKAR